MAAPLGWCTSYSMRARVPLESWRRCTLHALRRERPAAHERHTVLIAHRVMCFAGELPWCFAPKSGQVYWGYVQPSIIVRRRRHTLYGSKDATPRKGRKLTNPL